VDTGKLPTGLDLGKWVLQEPAKGGMKIVKNPSSHHDEYFHGSDTGGKNGGSVILCAPGNGGTSSHSQDPRSELREVGYDAHIKKGISRKLQAEVKVLHLSPSSKAKVVVGQIHAASYNGGNELNQLLKLHVKKNGDVEAEVKDKKGKGLPLAVTNIKDTWKLTYEIELNFDQLTVTANGKTVTYDYSWMPDKVKKDNYEFKAGNYCDPGEDQYRKSSDGCMVEFFSLASEHIDSSSQLAYVTV
jgi:hypothetical protein